MRSFAFTLLVFLAACGGGSSDTGAEFANNQGEGTGEGSQPTAAELFADCFQQDATQIAQILALLQGFFTEGDGNLPLPTLDLISGLLSGGVIPYTWDLDGDTVSELSGSLRFLDETGATTIPFTLGELSGLSLDDPTSLLAAIPAGSRVELVFALGGTLLTVTNEGAGDGKLIFTFGDETVSSIGGSGSFSSGPCAFDLDFDDIAIDLNLLEGLPVADITFTGAIGNDDLTGTIALDGTSTATVTTSLNGGADEELALEIPALDDLEALADLLGSLAGG